MDVHFLLALPIPAAAESLQAEIEAGAARMIQLSQSPESDSAEQSGLEIHLNKLVEQAFDLKRQLRNIDKIFARVFKGGRRVKASSRKA